MDNSKRCIQIDAYKKLAQQEPITPSLIASAVSKPSSLLPEPYEYPIETETGEKLPYDLMKILTMHQQRANRNTVLPPPPGIDPQSILKEREYRYVRIENFEITICKS